MLHSTSSAVKSALSGHSSTYTGLHELHRTSTVLKTAFQTFPGTSASPHALNSTFSAVTKDLSGHSSTYTGLHEFHRTFTAVKTAFSIFLGTSTHLHVIHITLIGGQNAFNRSFPHIHNLSRASQGLHSGENCFLDVS